MPGLEGIYQRPRVESWAGKLQGDLREQRAADDAKAQWAASKVMEKVKAMRESGNYTEEQIAAEAQSMIQRLPGAEKFLSGAGDVALPSSPLADQNYQNKMSAAEIQGGWLGGGGSPTQQGSASQPYPQGGVPVGQDGGIPAPDTPTPPSGRGASQAALDNLLKIYTAISIGGDQEGARKFLETATGLVRSSSLPPEDQLWAERILAGTATSAPQNQADATDRYKSDNSLAGTQTTADASVRGKEIEFQGTKYAQDQATTRQRIASNASMANASSGGTQPASIKQQVAGYKTVIERLDRMGELGETLQQQASESGWGDGIGRFEGPVRSFLTNVFGSESADYEELKTLVNTLSAERVYLLSGKQINEKEREDLKRFTPNLNQPPSQFFANLNKFRELAISYLEKYGADPSAITDLGREYGTSAQGGMSDDEALEHLQRLRRVKGD